MHTPQSEAPPQEGIHGGAQVGGRPISLAGKSNTRHARMGLDELRALQDVAGNAFRVYAALAYFRDDLNSAWPSRAALANLTGLSVKAVSTALSELTRAGLVEREQFGPDLWTTRFPLKEGLSR